MNKTVTFWRKDIPTIKVREFLAGGAFVEGEHFRFGSTTDGRTYIQPLEQMIFAADSKPFNFHQGTIDDKGNRVT